MVSNALFLKLKKVAALHFFQYPPARSLDAEFLKSPLPWWERVRGEGEKQQPKSMIEEN